MHSVTDRQKDDITSTLVVLELRSDFGHFIGAGMCIIGKEEEEG